MEGNSKMNIKEVSQSVYLEDLEEALEELDEEETKGNEKPDDSDPEVEGDDMEVQILTEKFETFNVKHKDNMQKVCLPANASVADLHLSISELFDISLDKQILHGCGLHANANEDENKSKQLGSLKLSAFNYIRVEESDTPQISIEIVWEPSGSKINLKMSSATTFGELKEHIYYITNIPVRYQEWSGPPKDPQVKCSDLKECDLTVRSSENPLPLAHAGVSSSEEESGRTSESSYFDGDETLTSSTDAIGSSLLISDGKKSILEGCLQFLQNYKKIYGEPSLNFFEGELKDAYFLVRNQQDDENKLLAIYLHHRDSVLTNIFCQNVLKKDEVLAIFNNFFIVFGWDMSRTNNATFFLQELKDTISEEAAEAVKKIDVEKFPAFLIVGKKKCGQDPKFSVIHGDIDVGALQTNLHIEYILLSEMS